MRLLFCHLSLSILLIPLFIITESLSISNPNAKQRLFDGECTDSFNQCQHVCIPNPTNLRKFHCTCRNGYYIQNDGHSCSESPPKELEMNFEINSGSFNEKNEIPISKVSSTVKKSTKKIVTRQKRYTDSKSKTVKPGMSLLKGFCSSTSCKNGGVCQTLKSNSNDYLISCVCRLGFEGVTCEKATTGLKFPKFLNGYLAFPERILNEINFRLSLIVRPSNDSQADTLIAFKQSLKGNNFILGLEHNQFIFRIETLKIQRKYQHQIKVDRSNNKWYKIEIERKNEDAKITVDNVESTIPLIELTLNEDNRYLENKNETIIMSTNFICDYCLYLGGHPQLLETLRKNENLFGIIENSYIGCIRNFKIDEVEIDMRRMPFYGKAVDGLGIDDCSVGLCETKSQAEPSCSNNGNCIVSNDFKPSCQCFFGFAGKYCEEKETINMPAFNGESFAIYNGLMGTSRSQNNIFIRFKPLTGTGILLYQGYSLDKRGDFMAIYLIDGIPHVSYDLGSGTIKIGSRKSVTLSEWHTIRFHRVGKKGTLIVDYGEPSSAFSPGSQVQLTIKQYLQLGGVDSFDNVSAFLSIQKGFKGCIQMLEHLSPSSDTLFQQHYCTNSRVCIITHELYGITQRSIKLIDNRSFTFNLFIDHHEINLINDLNIEKSRNLGNCDSHACAQKRPICWMGSICIPDYEKFICSCPLGQIDDFCQTNTPISSIQNPSFNGSSYLVYTDSNLLKKFSNPKFSMTIVVNLKVNQINRTLLHLISKLDMNTGQHFTVTINPNYGINLDLNNGLDNSVTNIIDNLPLLSDHKININKYENVLKFVINDTHEKIINLRDKNLSVLGFSKLFVGGTDLSTTIRLDLPVESGIVGCIKEFKVDNHKVSVSDADDGRTVTECNYK